METSQVGWKNATLFLLTLVSLLLCGLMLRPFVLAITGAVTLAVVTRRPYRWWCRRVRNRVAAAASAVVVVTISIIAPMLLLLQDLARHALAGAAMLEDGRAQRGVDAVLERFPQIASVLEHSSEFVNLSDAAQKFAGFFASHLMGFLGNSLAAITQIVIMLFLLFFLYRDESTAIRFIDRLLPLSEEDAHSLVNRLGETIRATVLGRLMIGLAQGAVAGGVFALLGLHVAFILGVLTAVVGLVPPFGAYLIWLPVAVYLAITGHWIKMIILLVIGSLIISTLDNFLYPVLVGSQLRQHTAAVFFSLLGGVWLFGIAGLVLGPLTFSAAEFLLGVWKAKGASPLLEGQVGPSSSGE